jgi:hypothetical protein
MPSLVIASEDFSTLFIIQLFPVVDISVCNLARSNLGSGLHAKSVSAKQTSINCFMLKDTEI